MLIADDWSGVRGQGLLTALVAGVAVFVLAGAAAPAVDKAARVPSEKDGPFTVYLSPSGDDTRSGLSVRDAVKSLERAEEIVARTNPSTDVEIRISRGVYTAPTTQWSTFVDGHTISFLPLSYDYGDSLPADGRPVFKSDGSAGYWFWASLPRDDRGGGDTALRFYYLEVRGYATGGLAIAGPIDVDGTIRRPVGAGMNENVVFGMDFTHLGDLHNSTHVGYGAVVLWNSSRNSIRNNHFRYLENRGDAYGLVHGVYLAHGSSENEVGSNAFYRITGSPVNIRNQSNFNRIWFNSFSHVNKNPSGGIFTDWFCGASNCLRKYPERQYECASKDNWLWQNEIGPGYGGGSRTAFVLAEGDNQFAGHEGCSLDGFTRLRTRGNVLTLD